MDTWNVNSVGEPRGGSRRDDCRHFKISEFFRKMNDEKLMYRCDKNGKSERIIFCEYQCSSYEIEVDELVARL